MKKIILTPLTLALALLLPAAALAQGYAYGGDPHANAQEARLNVDGYPYTVMNRPLLPPEERRKLRENQLRYQRYQAARDASIRHQFRTMSADERRYIIEHHGFPEAVMPGFK